MISNEKVLNHKFLELIYIYNFYFGGFFVQIYLNNSKFEYENMTSSHSPHLRNKMTKKHQQTCKWFSGSVCPPYGSG
jgi:hypothetical protein